MSTLRIALLALALAQGSMGVAFAEVVRREGSEQAGQIARMQQALTAATMERDTLAAAKAKLEEEKAALEKKLEQANRKLSTTEGALDRYRETDAALRDRLTEDRARMQELIERFRETAQNLRQVELERAELTSVASRQHEEIRACTQKNLDLYQANLDLLDRYEAKGVWASLFQREPVTGLKRVEVENMIEEYRYRLDQLVVSASAPSAAP